MISVLLHAGPGLDDYTLHLANALSESARVGYSISRSMLERYGDALDSRVTPLEYERPRRRHLWGFAEMSRLGRRIREFKPDIVHTQNDGMWESLLMGMLGELPVINTVHDPIKHVDHRNPFDLTFQRIGIRRACGWV